MYRCFTRDWWIDNFSGEWPNNLEPFAAGEQITRAKFETEQEAREFAQNWNKPHDAGRYSNKCEFESI